MVTPSEVAAAMTAPPEPGSSAELDEADAMAHHRPVIEASVVEEGETSDPGPAPPTDVPVVGAEVAVIDPAAQAGALDQLPDTAVSATQLQVFMRQAELLAGSTIIPRAYQGKPANVLVATLTGLTFGWDALTTMRNGHVIEGTWSMKPEAMLALVRKAGHRVEGNATPDEAWATGYRSDGTSVTVRWTMEDARRAGLHTKDNWKHYPASMLWARVVGQLCRMLFPDVLLGISYTPDELGADLDERGNVIEVTAVAATTAEGWNTPAAPGQPAPAQEERLTSDDTHAWLTEQAGALPEPHATELKEAWKATPELKGWTVRRMARRHAARARGMVNAHWANAIAAGVDRAAAVEAWRAAQAQTAATEAQEAQEAVPVDARGELTDRDREAIREELDGLVDRMASTPELEEGVPPNQERVQQLMENLEQSVEEAKAARQAPHASQTDAVEPPPAVETTAAEDAERERQHWRTVMGQQAQLVRAQGAGIPDRIVERIAGDVKALHHTAVNTELAEAGLAEDFPASSPIDLRRMVVARLRLEAFTASGVVGGTEPPAP